jgi:hypothetical protein
LYSHGAEASESKTTTLMPALHACSIVGLSAVGDAESIRIALTCWRIRLLIWLICSVAVLSAVFSTR